MLRTIDSRPLILIPTTFCVRCWLSYHPETAEFSEYPRQSGRETDLLVISLVRQPRMAKSHGVQFVNIVDSVRPLIRECTIQDVVRRQAQGD